MKAKLKVIKDWEFEEFELTGTSFKYSPTGCKGMVARSEDEIVFWTYHLAQKVQRRFVGQRRSFQVDSQPGAERAARCLGRSCLALMRQRNTVGLPGQ